MAYFHNKLSELHHSTYFIGRIIAFPFDLFVHPAEDLFLRMVLDNVAQVAILQITKLTTDNGRDAHTLGRFKTFMDSAVKAELQADYRQVLKEAKFKPRIRELIDKPRCSASRRLPIRWHQSPASRWLSSRLARSKRSSRELTKLFELASFDTEYRYLLIYYDPRARHPVGRDSRPDIERILEGIARDSPVLRLPESNPMAWPYQRETWSEKKIEQFNHYRLACGLSAV
jgi:hypothetical protein